MARIVSLLVHLHPPNVFIKLSLDRFSPYFFEPFRNGIINVRPSMAYSFVYPFNGEDLNKIAYHFDFDYNDGRDPSLYINCLKEEVGRWWELWKGKEVPTLTQIRRENMTMIADTRPCSVDRVHLIGNEEARVYELCETIHSFQAIFMRMQEKYRSLTERNLRNLLAGLVDEIMLSNNDKYLSLAIPI
jgi:hypothetical protein